MPCLELPDVELPQLPAPLTLGAALPEFAFDPTLCCKLLPFPLVTPPISLGVAVSPAIVTTINNAMAALDGYLDAFPLHCPKE